MPKATRDRLRTEALAKHNAFGRPLYRSIEEDFGPDIQRVTGGTATDL